MTLASKVYKATEAYPKSELYGLTFQTRKSAVSIPSNIAEGWSRQHTQEYLQFLSIAIGSAAELETQILLGNHLGFLGKDDSERLALQTTEIMKMLHGIRNKLSPKALTPIP